MYPQTPDMQVQEVRCTAQPQHGRGCRLLRPPDPFALLGKAHQRSSRAWTAGVLVMETASGCASMSAPFTLLASPPPQSTSEPHSCGEVSLLGWSPLPPREERGGGSGPRLSDHDWLM